MSEVFGAAYAGIYDLLYEDKDYEAECDMLERAFREFASAPVRRVLDLGCGTGGHAVPLARRGYSVTALDRSPAMLEHARDKAAASGVSGRVTFEQAELTQLPKLEPCDAAVMMFAVLGYLTAEKDQLAALRQARSTLVRGGVLVLDVWFRPAVEHDPPGQRWRIVEGKDGRTIRLSDGRLDRANETCEVMFRVIRIEGERVVGDAVEFHKMRYYGAETLRDLLGASGFELLRFGSFPEFWRDPDNDSWSVAVIARAV